MKKELAVIGTGVWKGYGPVPIEITEAMIDSAVSYYEERGLQVPVDMQHLEAEAYGWTTRLWKAPKDGRPFLWAEVEFNEEGSALVDAKKFRYISPHLEFNFPHWVTGENVLMELFSIAMTNYPFMNDLTALASKRSASRICASLVNLDTPNIIQSVKFSTIAQDTVVMSPEEFVLAVIALYAVPEDTDPKDLLAMITSDHEAAMELAGDAEAEDKKATAQTTVQNSKITVALAKSLNTTPAKLEAAVKELRKAGGSGNSAELESLRNEVTDLKTKNAENEAELFLSSHETKFQPSERTFLKEVYLSEGGRERVTKLLESRADIIPEDPKPKKGGQKSKADSDAVSLGKKVFGLEDKDFEEYGPEEIPD